jgi:MFS family permease
VAVLQIDRPFAYHVAFVANAVTYLLAAALCLRLPEVPPIERRPNTPILRAVRDLPYLAIILVFVVFSLESSLLSFGLPLWITQHTAAPRFLVSVVLLLNMAGSVAFQVPVARRVSTVAKAGRAARLGGAGLFAGCIAFAVTGSLPSLAAVVCLLLGAAIHVASQLFSSSAEFCLAMELAPADAQGQYQGLFGAGVALSGAIGPNLLALLPLGLGGWGWPVVGGMFLLAGLLTAPVADFAVRSRPGHRTAEEQTHH